jgi:O-antigen ligase
VAGDRAVVDRGLRPVALPDTVSDGGTLTDLRGATDSYRLAKSFLILMSLVTVDVFNYLDRGGATRYLVLLVPIGTIVWIRMHEPTMAIRRPATADVALLVLFLIGLLGSLVGVAFLGTQDTVRSVFIPMSLGLFYLFTLRPPTNDETDRMLRWLGWIGLVYTVMNFLVNTSLLPGLLAYKQYRNASFAYVALGIACAFVLQRRGRLVAMILMTAVIFFTYPSATSVLVLVTVFLTLFLTSRKASGLRTLVIGGTLVLLTAIALMNFQAGVKFTSDYFNAVGKADANAGRIDLWTAGVEKWRESPLVGNFFSGNATAVRSRDGKTLPYHNDFVLFLAEGGLLGAGLLIAWMLLAELTLISRYRGFVRSGQIVRANLVRVVLVTLNAFFVAMAFNPVLPGATRSATIFGLYAMAMSLGRPPTRKEFFEQPTVVEGALSAPAAPSV